MANPAPDSTSWSMALFLRFLRKIEFFGNKLPHPFWLFTIMAGIVVVLSAVLSAFAVSAVSPATGEPVEVRSLLSAEGMDVIFGDAVENFASFPPLALIIVVMLGVSVAEQSGLLAALLRGSVTRVPPKYLTFALAFAGVSGSVASDAAYVVLIPLGAMVFKAVGRSPILGLIVAFGSVSAGYNASVFVTPTDAVLAGITTSAAGVLEPGYVVNPLANYFFTFVSALVLSVVITLVTEFVLRRRAESMTVDADASDEQLGEMSLSSVERRGVRNAGLVLLAIIAVLVAALVPSGSPLRGADGSVLNSPVITGIAYLIGIAFLLIGAVYGRAVGTISRAREIPGAMSKGVVDLAPVVVLFFAASQFLAYFDWTGMGEIIAIRGADVLGALDVHPLAMLIGFAVIATLINLFITSGSAQWALVAPIFVPMFMLLGTAPEVTQAMYRIADSATNVISPMSPYFAMVLGMLQRYRKDAGVGTLMSFTLPISMAVLVVWLVLFVAWWALGLPLGPGVPVR